MCIFYPFKTDKTKIERISFSLNPLELNIYKLLPLSHYIFDLHYNTFFLQIHMLMRENWKNATLIPCGAGEKTYVLTPFSSIKAITGNVCFQQYDHCSECAN